MHQPQKHTILLINTALEQASVAIAENGILIDQITNSTQKEHASFLHPAIESLCKKNGITLKQLQAISVINGPGSYTGLRVGLAAAKGICYANGLPLICINTLEWIALGNRDHATDLIIPMIDARRMEVFTAAYSKEMETILAPTNLILDENSFSNLLSSNDILFVGNGVSKWKTICKHNHAHFDEGKENEDHHAVLANSYALYKKFSSVFNASPFYTKDFYSTQKQ